MVDSSTLSDTSSLFDFDQTTSVAQVVQHHDWGMGMPVVFEIDWTIVASAIGLLISSFAAIWCARRHRD
jgi:hypothetical protein